MTNQQHRPPHYGIAEASEAVEMHPQTLRKYERAGLLQPGRRAGGSRRYSDADIERLSLIKHLADVRRINVAGMSLVLSLHDELRALMDELGPLGAGDAARVAREYARAMLERIREEG